MLEKEEDTERSQKRAALFKELNDLQYHQKRGMEHGILVEAAQAAMQSKINNLLEKAREEAKEARELHKAQQQACADIRLSDRAWVSSLEYHHAGIRHDAAWYAKEATEKHLEQAELDAANFKAGFSSSSSTRSPPSA